ncbi:2-C-methyl-D-erythritol 4-phosphate cytidylyltransferase [Paeniglutamicibacter antarcticus]|uniref:2-C-methyl-D-erythritol 4-phosphate cytidylyltransferase n=1 Tax=Arthrobacter terrae TaxID=2935737 RepID=A0A931CXB1_9MICC|nr:2-C-methyl-D-erythritol 4-phosphate cytidylyltransferase [Arthrobacter terrae]MBG0741668.1 2-C-methyl-D-erythritol 4-phosphate cytidylyltransferase [Arthrobacter terrae]
METEGITKLAVIIVAAGSGERLGFGMAKAKVPVGSDPMLLHTLRTALSAKIAAQICVALPAGDTDLRALCESVDTDGDLKITTVDGGTTRAESVRAALAALDADVTAVLIQDAARPLTPVEVYHRVAQTLAAGALAVIPALPVTDTVKLVEGSTSAGIAPEKVLLTPDRAVLRSVQTPQGFDLPTLRRAYDAAAGFNAEQRAAVTDDAMLVEAAGVDVYVVMGSASSLKITGPWDLLLAEALLAGPLAPRWVEG